MTNIVSAGPWGHVKATVTASPAGEWDVRVWVDGVEKMPVYGLDRAEALEVAQERHDLHVKELQDAMTTQITLEDLVEGLKGLMVTPTKLSSILHSVRNAPGLDRAERIALARRLAMAMHKARTDLQKVRDTLAQGK